MPVPAIASTARSLAYFVRLQELTANNLANAESDGFKVDRMSARLEPDGRPVPVQSTDLQQGRLRDTGRALDVAIEGEGFLVVATPRGERLTRGGSLRLDVDSRLTDAHGHPVLGADGPITVHGDRLEILRDGTVEVDGAPAGRLRLEAVTDRAALLKEGRGHLATDAPRVAVADGATRLVQGAIEESNVDPMLGMVDLLNVHRLYATNTDALRALDSVLGALTREVGRVGP